MMDPLDDIEQVKAEPGSAVKNLRYKREVTAIRNIMMDLSYMEYYLFE